MSLRLEFVTLAQQEGANIRQLCQRFGISRKTGYKWLTRFQQAGAAGLRDQSRRPAHSPQRTPPTVEAQVLSERAAHPEWGGRKLRVRVADALPPDARLPSASTMTAILRRHGQLHPPSAPPHALPHGGQRFEATAPNLLWQMDFKGAVALQAGGGGVVVAGSAPPRPPLCHPLTVLDDHSRFALGLVACGDERAVTVRAALTAIFQRYGLPERLLTDNGSPWGGAHGPSQPTYPWTTLTVWLLRLGIQVSHGRPYHPQTQGKDERFHRTLHEELLRHQVLLTLPHAQAAFDRWREEYNLLRPHAALGYAPPVSRYQPSPRPFPSSLPPLEYATSDLVRHVQDGGRLSFHGATYPLGKAFVGLPVALRPTPTDGVWQVYCARQHIATLDERLHVLTPP